MKTLAKIRKKFTSFLKKKSVTKNSCELSSKGYDGFIDSYDGQYLNGWAVNASEGRPAKLSILANGILLYELTADKDREDLIRVGIGSRAFKAPLKIYDLDFSDDAKVEISAIFSGTSVCLNNSPLIIRKPKIAYSLMKTDSGVLKGWVRDTENPSVRVELCVLSNDTVLDQFYTPDYVEFSGFSGVHGFLIDPEKYGLTADDIKVQTMGAEAEVLKINSMIVSRDEIISALYKIQSELRSGCEVSNKDYLLNKILPLAIGAVRNSVDCSEMPLLQVQSEASKDITVIIPVYAGLETTIACISSVLNAKNVTSFSILVIDDCGPDDRLREAVSALAEEHKFSYIKNERNLGFVRTCNIGMKWAGGADVVLLNSDTLVSDFWLDALVHAASEEDNIGTVTPLSNNASICSFPDFCEYNQFPENIDDLDSINRICRMIPKKIMDIPTANGFCMYIKREVLNSVGYFDENHWGDGYGEENDLSMRAATLGWRNIATNQAFVYHHGSVSFSERASELMEKNLKKLISIYPEYPGLVGSFIKSDPMASLRNDLALKLIHEYLKKPQVKASCFGGGVLLVSHSYGGGTLRATSELTAELESLNVPVYMLQQVGEDCLKLTHARTGMIIKMNGSNAYSSMLSVLKDLNIVVVHYHHIVEFDWHIRDLASDLSVPYLISIHDYYSVCPRLSLIDNNGQYCNEPDAAGCASCMKLNGINNSVRQHPAQFDWSISEWRLRNEQWLMKASAVVVPDQDVSVRLKKYFQGLNPIVVPHEKPIEVQILNMLPSNADGFCIGVVGAIGYHKGFSNLVKIAKYIDENSVPARIKIIGHTENDTLIAEFKCVTLTGPYKADELSSYLKDVDLVFFPGECPETYSYVLSEVVAEGKKVIAYEVGAIASRLKAMNWGRLVPLATPIRNVIESIEKYNSEIPCEVSLFIGDSAAPEWPQIIKEIVSDSNVRGVNNETAEV